MNHTRFAKTLGKCSFSINKILSSTTNTFPPLHYAQKWKKVAFTQRLYYQFASKTINLPNVADSVSQGKVAEIVKNVGDWAELDDTVALLETDKVTVDIKAPVAGVITKFHVNLGDNAQVGKPFFDIDSEGTGKKTTKPEKKQEKSQEVSKQKPAPQQDKPQKQQQKSQQRQTASKPKQQTKTESKPSPKQNSQLKFSFSSSASERKETKEPLSAIRLKSGERLKQVQNVYALLTTFQECDVGNVLEIIEKYQQPFTKKYGTNLGLLAFFVKASANAIVQNPIVNSIIDGLEIVKRNYVDINVSIATSFGTISPVLKNCNVRSIDDIQTELAQISRNAQSGKLSVEQLDNGTFCISNGEVDSSLMSTPILRPLQSGLLGINSVVTKPVARNGQIVARPTMFISLTYDHRILDGKDAVVTLKSIKEQIQEPSRILLGM